jgi:hypothetical protein
MRGLTDGRLRRRTRRLLLAVGALAALALPGVAATAAGARPWHNGHHARTERFLGHKVG